MEPGEAVIPAGIEPTTVCLEGRCSIQLSYGTARGDREGLRQAGAKMQNFLPSPGP